MKSFDDNLNKSDASSQVRRANTKNSWVKISMIIITTTVIALLLMIVFINLGNYLVVNEAPVQSDIIVVLSGDDGARTERAVSLWEQGFSDKLLFSGCADSTAVMAQQALAAGVPEDSIIVEDKSDSTYENAVNSKAVLLEYGYESAIVVTSNYHMRRSMLVFNKAFKATEISLVYCSAPEEGFTSKRWWTDRYSINLVCSEYIRLVGYFVKGQL